MITVYFETNGHAEQVATFQDEETYCELVESLEAIAKANGFDKVTESVT